MQLVKYLIASLMLLSTTFVCALETQEYDQDKIEEEMKKLPQYEQKFIKALQYAQAGDWERAMIEADASLKLNQSQPGVYFLESQIKLVENDNKAALDKIRKAQELAPESKLIKSQVTFHEAIEIQMTGDYPAALQKFKLCMDQMGDEVDPKSLEKVAIAVAGLGDIATAIDIVKKLWKIAPFYMFHNNLQFVRMADKYDEMVEHSATKGAGYVDALNKDLSNITTVTDKVWMEFELNGESKRVEFGLYGYAAPRAVHNLVFMFACTLGENYCYKGTKLHRVIKDFIVQGGDVFPGDGTGRVNIYDRPYGDEVFATALMHDAPGVVQIANSGADSNGGQFVIMCAPAAHLNGQHVVVGKVLSGMEHIHAANQVEVDSDNKPKVDITVTSCGTVEV